MNKKMLKARTILKYSQALLEVLKETEPDCAAIPVIESLIDWSKTEYLSLKQVEHSPSVVYQMYGKKTSQLTPEEDRAYKALLKRQRDARKRELRKN